MSTVNEASGMSNALDSDRMTARERLAEVAAILAMGLKRLRARKSSPLFDRYGESWLDFLAERSGHGPGSQQVENWS